MEQRLKEVECNLRDLELQHAQETGDLKSEHKYLMFQQKLKFEKTIDEIRFAREEATSQTQQRLKKIYEGYNSRAQGDSKAELLAVVLGGIVSIIFIAYFIFGIRLTIKPN